MKRSTLALSALLAGSLHCAGASLGAPPQLSFPAPPEAAAGVPDFTGTWVGRYSSNVVPPTDVTLIFQQRGATVTGTYLAANGAQGVMYGIAALQQTPLQAEQKTPTCLGAFAMPSQVQGNTMTWKFIGKDCLGDENGTGSATRSGS